MSGLPRGSFVADICVLRVFGHRLWPPISFDFFVEKNTKLNYFVRFFRIRRPKCPPKWRPGFLEKKVKTCRTSCFHSSPCRVSVFLAERRSSVRGSFFARGHFLAKS